MGSIMGTYGYYNSAQQWTSSEKDLANKNFDFMIIRITELQNGFLEEMIKQSDNMLFIITTNNQRDCKKYNDNMRVLAVLLKPIKSNKLLKAFSIKWKPLQRAKKKTTWVESSG